MRPYRLLTSLLDKPEIGPAIIDDIVLDVFRYEFFYTAERQKRRCSHLCSPIRTLYHSHRAAEAPRAADLKLTAATPTQRSEKREQEEREGRKKELLKSANLLFGTFESGYIWDFCGGKVSSAARETWAAILMHPCCRRWFQFSSASRKKQRMNDSHTSDVNSVGAEHSTVIEMAAIVDFLLDAVSIETFVDTTSEHLPRLAQHFNAEWQTEF